VLWDIDHVYTVGVKLNFKLNFPGAWIPVQISNRAAHSQRPNTPRLIQTMNIHPRLEFRSENRT
jgi:hypothetical protein